MANRRDDYMNKRSWLIDTAETPADKKRLRADIAKLDTQFNPNKVAKRNSAGLTTKSNTVNKIYRPSK